MINELPTFIDSILFLFIYMNILYLKKKKYHNLILIFFLHESKLKFNKINTK